jgi:hypothetical protein
MSERPWKAGRLCWAEPRSNQTIPELDEASDRAVPSRDAFLRGRLLLTKAPLLDIRTLILAYSR